MTGDRYLMARFWIALCLAPWLATGALAAPAPKTVGDYITQMNDIGRRLDLQVAQRQQAGEVAAAQRVALVAAMVRRASAEFRGAEQAQVTDEPGALPAPIKSRIDAAYARASEAETRAAADPRFIDEAQATFNALIEALPEPTPHPTFYGLLANDLTDAEGRLPADVVIYGDRIVDPVYATPPVVSYAGTELPPEAVRVAGDRLEVTLPESVKAAVHFAPPPCARRPPFGLRVHSVYAQAHEIWPILWHTTIETNDDVFALASPILFEARVSGLVEAAASEAASVPFRQLSDFAVADCEQTKTVEVAMAPPEGASDVVCQARWVSLTGKGDTSGACQTREGKIVATGTLTGAAKVCSPDKICSCTSLTQGFLEISGAYRVSRTASGLKPLTPPTPLVFAQGALAEQAFPERARQLKIDISRRDCPVVADRITIDLGGEADASALAMSPSAAFRAAIGEGRLRVGSAEAFTSSAAAK